MPRHDFHSSDRLSSVLPAAAGGTTAPVGEPEPPPRLELPPEPPPEPPPRGLRRFVPPALRGARLDPGRPGATAVVAAAAVAAAAVMFGVWSARPQAEPVAALPAVSVAEQASSRPASDPDPPPAGSSSGSSSGAPVGSAEVPPGPLVVSVSGKVARPGLVQVPAGARVADAINAAGGALPGTDLAGVNLARRLADGEQVAVGVPPAADTAAVPPGAGGARGSGPVGKVDLNVASVEQLDALPGVGPVTAERIVEWRSTHGRFARVEQLREIEGIGERRFGQLRGLVTV
ncbi:ComEA family DNA-binding protein [Actinomycetes bacterium KLBMP 9759]